MFFVPFLAKIFKNRHFDRAKTTTFRMSGPKVNCDMVTFKSSTIVNVTFYNTFFDHPKEQQINEMLLEGLEHNNLIQKACQNSD